MAIRDYIVCKRCEYKILYDEHYHGREMMQALWGDPSAVFWTPLLLCPACIALLESELAACREAIGMLTTLAPHMEINPCDPLGMAHQIVATVSAELAECREALSDMVFQFFYENDDGTISHSFMSAEEHAIGYLLSAGMAEEVSRGRYRLIDAARKGEGE